MIVLAARPRPLCHTAGVDPAADAIAREIDALLDAYDRELEYFESTAALLIPLMRDLLAAIDAAFASPSDPQVLEGARNARARYVEALQGLQPLLDDWLKVRGSNWRAWEAEPAMSDLQYARLERLSARETALALGRDEFDRLQDAVRSRLLLFEEANRGR